MPTEGNHGDVVSLAYSIVEMHREIIHLRAEVKRLREIESDYWKFLNDTHAHSQKMTGAMLAMAIGGESLAKDILEPRLAPGFAAVASTP